MGWWAKAAATAGVWMGLAAASVPAWSAQAGKADFGAQRASDDAHYVANRVVESADHRGLPFAVVDKKDARVYVFDGTGRLGGTTVALLGQAIGDESAPEVGEHAQEGDVPVDERTTPAGRFLSAPGRNLQGDAVVWLDYAAAFAIHRLRPGASLKSREARLASESPDDNRASLGCVIVPGAFFDAVVLPLLGRGRAVVYVLPETRSVRDVFGAL